MEFQKGHIPWNKGRVGVYSEATLKKISEANKYPKTEEAKRKMSKAKKNMSEETKRKMSEAAKGRWHSATYRKKTLDGQQKHWLSKEPTSIEKKVYSELKERGLLFEKQKLINGKFLVDAYIPSLNLVIEADGDYWHSLDRVVKKDKAENAYLIKCGYDLIRLSEKEINNNSFLDKLPVTKKN